MAYIEQLEYVRYTKSSIPVDFDILAEVASNQINLFTMFKIGDNLDRFDEELKEIIKKATAFQVAYLEGNGSIDSLMTRSDKVTTAKIGSFSYTLGSGGDNNDTGVDIAKPAELMLTSAGLTYSGVGVCL